MTSAGIATFPILKFSGEGARPADDLLAVEEPLEIRLGYSGPDGVRASRTVSITMRTPGHDLELAAGFLFTEGILRDPADIGELRACGPAAPGGHQNIVRVELRDGARVDLSRLERNFYTSSSCGVCGKTSLEALRAEGAYLPAGEARRLGPRVSAVVIHGLPGTLRQAQAAFEATGGLHATGLFSVTGELLAVREDVGRHNAFDKIVGRAFLDGRLPLADSIALVSGRASFELLQKAAMAGLRAFAAVGAPSSLAAELAREHGITLVGFVRGGRFNAYAGEDRIHHEEAGHEAQNPGELPQAPSHPG